MRKKLWLLLAAALPLLCGCMMSASVDDLYALPQLPEEYESLSARLSEILALGAEYAAPQAGANLPPVQMVDLDGDGTDEALGFFRISSEERPLKIYVFRAVEDDYQQAAVIDGPPHPLHPVRGYGRGRGPGDSGQLAGQPRGPGPRRLWHEGAGARAADERALYPL